MRAAPFTRKLVALALVTAAAVFGVRAESGPARNLFPTTPGLWWYYATDTKVLDEHRNQRLFIANVAFDGHTLLQRRQGVWDHLYAIGSTAVEHRAYLNRESGGREVREAEAVLLPIPAAQGATWAFKSRLRLIETYAFSIEERLTSRYVPVEMEARIEANDDTVAVPAGRYAHCVRVNAIGKTQVPVDQGRRKVEVAVTQTEWYAPGVGLVKTRRVERANSPFLKDGEYLQELLETGS